MNTNMVHEKFDAAGSNDTRQGRNKMDNKKQINVISGMNVISWYLLVAS